MKSQNNTTDFGSEYLKLRDQHPFSLLKGDGLTQAERYELIEELMAQALINVGKQRAAEKITNRR